MNKIYDKYQIVMGAEVHAQTIGSECKMKVFSSASADNEEIRPNHNIDFLDYGLPGSLPVLNEKVVELAVRAGLALNCKINKVSIFDDKNYSYVDMSCGRQITQFYHPIATGGYVPIPSENNPDKTVRLNRIHIEQDAGKNLHDIVPGYTAVDYNRAGVGLLEIVTEPCIYSIDDVGPFLKSLRSILRAIKICNCDMEKGEMRVDLSVSVRLKTTQALGTRVEIKNVNSISFVQRAAQYEFERQIEAIEAGKSIIQETRLFDPKSGITKAMRNKEDSDEYLYSPDYNLPALEISDEFIAHQRAILPTLPQNICSSLVSNYEVNWFNAYVISLELEYTEFFNKVIARMSNSQIQIAAKWMTGDLFGLLNTSDRPIDSFNPQWLRELVVLLDSNAISGKIAKELLLNAFKNNISPASQAKDVEQVSDVTEIASTIDLILKECSAEVAKYKNGKTSLIGFFVGKVMQRMKNANPSIVNQVLEEKLQ